MGIIDFFGLLKKKRRHIHGHYLPLEVVFYFDDMKCESCFNVPFLFNQESGHYECHLQLFWDKFVEANPELNRNLVLRDLRYLVLKQELEGSGIGFKGINYLEPGRGIDIKLLIHIKEEKFYEFVSEVQATELGRSMWTELCEADTTKPDIE